MIEKASRTVSRFDLFSIPVTLQNANEYKIKTAFSAIISLLIVGFSIFYLTKNIISVVNHEKISTTIFQTVQCLLFRSFRTVY